MLGSGRAAGKRTQEPRSSRMRSGFTHNYAERYVERFTVAPCSEKLATTYRYASEKTSAPGSIRLENFSCPNAMHGTFGLLSTGKASSHSIALPSCLNLFFPVCSVSVIHRTLAWTTGSLTCVRDHSCAYTYTRWLGIQTASQQNISDSEQLTNCSCAPGGVRTPGLWISSRSSAN